MRIHADPDPDPYSDSDSQHRKSEREHLVSFLMVTFFSFFDSPAFFSLHKVWWAGERDSGWHFRGTRLDSDAVCQNRQVPARLWNYQRRLWYVLGQAIRSICRVSISVANPGSGAFWPTDPGSGKGFFPDPRSRISDPGSQTYILESLLTIFFW